MKVNGFTLEMVFIIYSSLLPFIVTRLASWQSEFIFSKISEAGSHIRWFECMTLFPSLGP